jgi:hypothetical protein
MSRARQRIQPFRQRGQNVAAALAVSHVADSGMEMADLEAIWALLSHALIFSYPPSLLE